MVVERQVVAEAAPVVVKASEDGGFMVMAVEAVVVILIDDEYVLVVLFGTDVVADAVVVDDDAGPGFYLAKARVDTFASDSDAGVASVADVSVVVSSGVDACFYVVVCV